MPTKPVTQAPPIPNWTIRVAEIGENGRHVRFAATPTERAAMADALDLVALEGLVLTGQLTARSRGRARLEGRMTADLAQACVVTLEPVPARIDVAIDIEFWPQEDIATQASATFDALGGDDPEPLDGDSVDLGRLAYETLGANLAPYPRRPGAEFKGPAAESEPPRNNPFGVLGALKPKG